MGFSHKKTVIYSAALLLVIAAACQADFGAQDLMRQARALQQQQPRQQQRPQRRLKPAQRNQEPLLKRSDDINNRFSSFGLNEAEVQGKYRPASGYQDSERDGAKYDRNGNRIQYSNANADRRSEQLIEPEVEQVVVDLPRQKYNYQKPPNPEQVYAESKPREVRRPQAPQENANSRSGEVYAPASGPAYADSSVSGSNSIPHEQRDIEAAVASGAAAFGVPNDGVYQTEDRLSFQIHGQEGPHSYKYGYDTGNGYNRQFRYEERNGAGYVKGRYGFFDKEGKLQVVNYSADPLLGFHAEGSGVPEYPH